MHFYKIVTFATCMRALADDTGATWRRLGYICKETEVHEGNTRGSGSQTEVKALRHSLLFSSQPSASFPWTSVMCVLCAHVCAHARPTQVCPLVRWNMGECISACLNHNECKSLKWMSLWGRRLKLTSVM